MKDLSNGAIARDALPPGAAPFVMRGAASEPTIAYFSMEIGLAPRIQTYSGGLGVLAGDGLRAAADLGIPMVGVSLLYRDGYFSQRLDARGYQSEEPSEWDPTESLEPLPLSTTVMLEGRNVALRVWRYVLTGISGHTVPVFLLDARVEENSEWDRTLTDSLYGGDQRYRLCQEVLLGLGGLAVLKALFLRRIHTFHMNEGHSALLTLGLLEEHRAGRGSIPVTGDDLEAVRARCVFTTHTPVPAGHDRFPRQLAMSVLGEQRGRLLGEARCLLDGELNLTHLGLFFSHYINGVSMRHEQISRGIFPNYPFNSITNGVHAVTWTSPHFRRLFDDHIPEWRRDNLYLRYAVSIPRDEIWQAHVDCKKDLIAEIDRRTGVKLDGHVLTIGFARRATRYKRADLLFTDQEQLRRIAREIGPMQIIYGGKAHPRDDGGKAIIRRVFEAAEALRPDVSVVYLAEYDMTIAAVLCAGVDLWLNTPERPHEASGTSGMKAALNGIPSLSVLDGWWIEGHQENVTGWSIGDGVDGDGPPREDSEHLYEKLESRIVPMFYGDPAAFRDIMRSTIALNGSFFNAQRMMVQYEQQAYAELRRVGPRGLGQGQPPDTTVTDTL